MMAIIVDIDGTLADVRHRVDHVTNGKREWSEFFKDMINDPVIEPVKTLVLQFYKNFAIVIVSGRPDGFRDLTEEWLSMNGIPYDALFMRREGDTRPDHVIKAEIYEEIIKEFDPFLVVDDRPAVVDMWRSKGLVCLQNEWLQKERFPETAILNLMVGPSGSGKTTWLKNTFITNPPSSFGIHPSHVISSDQVRQDLLGDFKRQDRNDDVFAAIHEVVRTRAKHGLPTTVDATHLRRKDRLTMVGLVPETVKVRYIVMNRSMEDKQRDAGWRREVPGLLERHENTFNSQLSDILAGDNRPNVTVVDLRQIESISSSDHAAI